MSTQTPHRIEELDPVRLTVPLEGTDVFDKNNIVPLPVGTEGTVVLVFGDGEAYEVEFMEFNNPNDPEDFVSVQLTVEASQCERVPL